MIRTASWGFLLLVFASPCFAMDLESSIEATNLSWSAAKRNTTSDLTFQGADWAWGVTSSLSQDLGSGIGFRGGIDIDPVLRWRAYSQMSFALDHLTVRFAPFLGTFNSTQTWFNPGMQASVKYIWPGFMSVGGGFLTTFAPVAKAGDYYLSDLNANVSALLENGIVTFRVEDKSATFRVNANLTTVDDVTKYWVDTEMFMKNFSLRGAILLGYQKTSRTYIDSDEVIATLHSFLLGTRFSWDFGRGTSVFAQVESSLFSTAWDSASLNLPDTVPLVDIKIGTTYHW